MRYKSPKNATPQKKGYRPMKQVAKALLMNEQGEILALYRSASHPRYAHEIDFPGGEVEDGEDAIQATIREIEEETGLVVEPRTIRVITESIAESGTKHSLLLGNAPSDSIHVQLSWEHEAYKWLSKDEALQDLAKAKDDYSQIVRDWLRKYT